MIKALSVMLMAFALTSAAYSQKVAFDRARVDTLAGRYLGYVYVKDTARFQMMLWVDSTATPGCPPAGTAYLWYAGGGVLLSKFPDCSVDTLNGGGGGGGGGSGNGWYSMAGTDTVLADTTTIYISSAFTSYIVLYSTLNYSGEEVGASIINQLVGQFDVAPVEDGIMEWLAVPIGGNTVAGTTPITTSGTYVSFASSAWASGYSQAGVDSISTGGTTITLPRTFEEYILLWNAQNYSGEAVGAVVSNRTATSFDATPIEDGTMEWTAVPKSYLVRFRCENASGEGVAVEISDKSTYQFKATPVENGTLSWTIHPF